MAILDFQVRNFSPASTETIHILLQADNKVNLEPFGFRETSRAGDIAAGMVPSDRLEQLKAEKGIGLIEATRYIKDELDNSILALGLQESFDSRKFPSRGQGALIGIIDSGFELTHPSFRNFDSTTRILAAWDQTASDPSGTKSPKPFKYGVEYSRSDIEKRISNHDPPLIIRNDPGAGAHGTAVAGIAAGNGMPFGIYEGVAPEAELILVSYRNDVQIGGSAFVLDAIAYILSVARSEKKPVVINLSQGDNLGAHDGSSLLEIAIDKLLETERLLIVNSAGNGRGGGRHAEGDVRQDELRAINFRFNENEHVTNDTVDIWYKGEDRFSIALRGPNNYQSEFLSSEGESKFDLPNGGVARVYSDLDYPTNHDNRITLVFDIPMGHEASNSDEWTILLRGDHIKAGHFHAWCDKPNGVSAIVFAEPTDDSTVTLPGTARKIITVSGFVSRPVDLDAGRVRGDLSGGTSLGPTRDGRPKPDITAPSSMILAPKLSSPSDGPFPAYTPFSGTSMAAPHVTGLIALAWAHNPNLKPTVIRSALLASTTADHFTGTVPNLSWGNGKVNAARLFRNLFEERMKIMSTQQIPLELRVPVPGSDDAVPFSLVITIEDGDIAGITGESEGESVQGTLLLRRSNSHSEGGDQCWVCTASGCREVTPCPSTPN